MATYPSIPRRTRIRIAEDGFILDRSDAGTARVVDLSAEVLYSLEITHPLLDGTDRDTLIAWWATNKGGVHTVPGPDGNNYECPIVGEPEVTDVTATRFNVRVNVVGNRSA